MIIPFERPAATLVAPAGISPRAVDFLERADSLLARARSESPDEALELTYQAGLRVAGAVLAQHPGRRRGADHGAWARVRRHAPQYAGYAAAIDAFSDLRRRALMGLGGVPADSVIAALRDAVEEFRGRVEGDFGILSAAA